MLRSLPILFLILVRWTQRTSDCTTSDIAGRNSGSGWNSWKKHRIKLTASAAIAYRVYKLCRHNNFRMDFTSPSTLNKKRRFHKQNYVILQMCSTISAPCFSGISSSAGKMEWYTMEDWESTLPEYRERWHQQIETMTLADRGHGGPGPPSVPTHQCHEVVMLPSEPMTVQFLASNWRN